MAVTLSVAEYFAATKPFATADLVTISDEPSAISALTPEEIGALQGNGVDVLNATKSQKLTLSLAQYNALGSVALTSGNSVTLSDTGVSLAALTADDIVALGAKGIDVLAASDHALTLAAVQAKALAAAGLALSGRDVVAVADTGATLGSLTAGEITALASQGIDVLDASDDVLMLTQEQLNALGGIALVAGDAVTLVDDAAALGSLTATQASALAAKGVDVLDVNDGTLALAAPPALALAGTDLTFAPGNTIKVVDAGATLATLSVAQITALAAKGFDTLDAGDDAFAMTVAQAKTLVSSSINLDSSDVAILFDTGAHLSALTAEEIGLLSTKGFDVLDVSDDALILTVAQLAALGSTWIAQGDQITVYGTSSSEQVIGTSTNDILYGFDGDDVLSGGDLVDQMFGGAGNDVLNGGTGADQLHGESGNDIYYVDDAFDWVIEAGVGTDIVITNTSYGLNASAAVEVLRTSDATAVTAIDLSGSSSANIIQANAGANKLDGKAGADKLYGYGGNDLVSGGSGNDAMNAGAGSDRLVGGRGQDVQTGGAGRDYFVFDDRDTGATAKTADYILDFRGKLGDKLDLRLVDANVRVRGDQKFSFIGEADHFTEAGQVRYETTRTDTRIFLNTDADASAEAVIRLKGSMELSKGWFML